MAVQQEGSEARPPQPAEEAGPARVQCRDDLISEFEASSSSLTERGAGSSSASESRAAFPEGAQAQADATGP